MFKLKKVLLLSSLLLSLNVIAETDSSLNKKENYALGNGIGRDIKKSVDLLEINHIPYDIDSILEGFKDSLLKKPILSKKEMNESVKLVSEKMKVLTKSPSKEQIEKNNIILNNFSKEEGMKKTKSGLLYKVIELGEGKKPSINDTINLHYSGNFPDKSFFNSSYKMFKRPAIKIKISESIKGWKEILPLMTVGSSYKVIVPPELSYGQDRFEKAPPNTIIIFEIELLEINN
jgi:FKBP-type peptidyl-prolyl cis-trans isomerase FkpA